MFSFIKSNSLTFLGSTAAITVGILMQYIYLNFAALVTFQNIGNDVKNVKSTTLTVR